jgi:hypothetical protein
MSPNKHPGRIIAEDTEPTDAVEEVLTDLPFTRDEVDELLYGSDQRSTAERLDRLRELADHLRVRMAGDMTNGDPVSLLDEVENAISVLESDERRWEQGVPEDPADHRETLSPDSDELEEIEEEDEESIEDDVGDLDDENDEDDEDEDEEDEDQEDDGQRH